MLPTWLLIERKNVSIYSLCISFAVSLVVSPASSPPGDFVVNGALVIGQSQQRAWTFPFNRSINDEHEIGQAETTTFPSLWYDSTGRYDPTDRIPPPSFSGTSSLFRLASIWFTQICVNISKQHKRFFQESTTNFQNIWKQIVQSLYWLNALMLIFQEVALAFCLSSETGYQVISALVRKRILLSVLYFTVSHQSSVSQMHRVFNLVCPSHH